MAIKPEGNLNSDKDTKDFYSILVGMQEDLFELQAQIDELNGGEPAPVPTFNPPTVTQIDATNFNITVVVNDGAEVDKVNVSFQASAETEPMPATFQLTGGVLGEGGERTFTKTDLTFADPVAAVGKSYVLDLAALDVGDTELSTDTQEVTVMGM